MKKISILGSTGSIGSQSLDIIRNNDHQYKVAALSCACNIELLCQQIEEFKPTAVAVKEESHALLIRKRFKGVKGLKGMEIFHGKKGLRSIASMEDCDMVLNSLMGMRGLEPTMAAIEAGKDIAFANKETLVAGGQIVMDAVRRKGVKLLPVDSEHSAIFQSIQGQGDNPIRRIILTASGGPFRGCSRKDLEIVTLKEALNHPNWAMGSKITIDSATMMNKGFEIIEARWLFDIPAEKIQVVIHPQSILHSAVEFQDGSVIGQMGNPDMKIPIAYAFSYPHRLNLAEQGVVRELSLFDFNEGLTFYPPDEEVFKTTELAREAVKLGGSYPVVLNGANEVLVEMFLRERISFTGIQDTLVRVMEDHVPRYDLNLEGILEEDSRIREEVRNKL